MALSESRPLRLLARPDKWYLGAGDGLVWAPPFPQWLDAPGFWDEAHLFQYGVGPLYTLSFVSGGVALPLRGRARRWTPESLTLDYDVGPLRARETRSAPGGSLRSGWAVRNPTSHSVQLDVVVWVALDPAGIEGEARTVGGSIAVTRVVADRHGHRTRIATTLSLAPRAQSTAVAHSQRSGTSVPPRFELTPFWDQWRRSGQLAEHRAGSRRAESSLVFVGLQRRFRVPARGTVRFAAASRIVLAQKPAFFTQPPIEANARRFFETVPMFRCSDAYLERHWWYRWYGLRLNGLARGSAPNYRHHGVCEGIGYFHVPITYSAPCHMRELRWFPDPSWARGVFRTCFDHQRPDGGLHGRVYADHLEGTDFYHADWGGAVLALDAAHPDAAFRREAYARLARYAEWLQRSRDPEETGMIDVRNQFETGQEYMSRYQAVDPEADRAGWEGRFRLQGIDVTVYAYRLFRALEMLALEVAPESAARWRTAAERSAAAVGERMWDPALELFSDVDSRTGRRTGVKAAVCFYPYAADLTDDRHVAGFARHLFDRRQFWTPFPVPSSSRDDPRFDPDALWDGVRHNCPWNGRVWPMTNSHIADALARIVREQRPAWAPRLGHFLGRFVRMMTYDGRVDRPNCFEHYHPISGRGSLYRGVDDYQHSWVNDLIVSHVVGVLPHGATGFTVHPLRVGVDRVRMSGLPVAGHDVEVRIADGRFQVRVDGRAAGRGRVGEPVSVSF